MLTKRLIVHSGDNSQSNASLGFMAYSVRIDNLSNQWLFEQTSASWIPPYTTARVIRLAGTQVAQIANKAPGTIAQMFANPAEYFVATYMSLDQADSPGFTYLPTVALGLNTLKATQAMAGGAWAQLPALSLNQVVVVGFSISVWGGTGTSAIVELATNVLGQPVGTVDQDIFFGQLPMSSVETVPNLGNSPGAGILVPAGGPPLILFTDVAVTVRMCVWWQLAL